MKNAAAGIPFGTLEREFLSNKIAHRLLTLIKERRLRPGDCLPSERELAKIMNVSRPSLREALRALLIMNIIESRKGSGTCITSLEPERLIEHIDIIFTLDESTYTDLFDARKILEPGIAELAARCISGDEIARLEEIMEQAKEALDDPEAFLEIDLELHRRITEATGNGILTVFMRSISRLGVYSRRRTGERIGVRRRTLEDHRAIVAALKKHDPRAAHQAMAEHLAHIEKGLTNGHHTTKKES